MKCLYSIRHAQARVKQTECIYGMLKIWFPILKGIGTTVKNTIKITIAWGVLHNISLEMNDDVNELPAVQEDEIIIQNNLPPAEAREAGCQVREYIKDSMPPPTAAEQ